LRAELRTDPAVTYVHLKIISLSLRKLEKLYTSKSEVLNATEKVKPKVQSVHTKYVYSVGKIKLRCSAQKPRTQACSFCEEMFVGRGLRASTEDTGESCGSSNQILSHLRTLENPSIHTNLS
jgi:formylmethanofuran dehydrogenase subunit E